MIEGKIPVPASLLSRLAEIERASRSIEKAISRVHAADISHLNYDQFLPTKGIVDSISKFGINPPVYYVPSHLSSADILSGFDFYNPHLNSSQGFKERIEQLKIEYGRTKNVKLISQIQQLTGELKAAVLKELRKELKIFKREAKLIINTLSGGGRSINLRIIYRQIFHFLFKNLCDEEHLEISISGMKTPIFIFKYYNNENFFFKGSLR